MSLQMPTVSIIVPNYNYSRFLKERMDSIFNQTFSDYEIILLDDASTDNSREILMQYKDNPKVSAIIINDKNTGIPFLQWKKGIELAKGRYVWIAESDDSASPHLLRTAVEALQQNPKATLAFTGSKAINGQGDEIDMDYDDWSDTKHKKRIGKTLVHNGKKFVIHNQYWRCHVYNASATVFRRDAFNPQSDFAECFTMRNSGDWLFWSIIAGKGDVIEIYDKLNMIRRHDSNQTEKGMARGNIYIENLKVLKHIENNFKVGIYRKVIRHGTLYKQMKRFNIPDELKTRIFKAMHDDLGITKCEYVIERIHKFLWNIIPGLISQEQDRL